MPQLYHFLLLHLWLFSVASQALSRESQQVTNFLLGNWQVNNLPAKHVWLFNPPDATCLCILA